MPFIAETWGKFAPSTPNLVPTKEVQTLSSEVVQLLKKNVAEQSIL